MTVERDRLRTTFGEDAELYDRMRPTYPAELFNELAALAGLAPGASVLEIGPGTGQATRALALRGYRVTGVELSADMARICRRRCAGLDVRIDVSAFEDWAPGDERFDLVFAATAFHWVDPAVRYRKSAEVLRPGGALATVRTEHIAGGSSAFFEAVQRCYEKWDPLTTPGLKLLVPEAIPFDADDIEQSALFEAPTFRRYEWEQTYSIAEYRDLLLTYSGHRAMPREMREGLLACIAQCANGNALTKRYMFELRLARLTSSASRS
jgi:SAM-dependent methyltransferase